MRYNPLELCEINSKYESKLPQNLKSELGRVELLKTTAWRCTIRQLRDKRKRCTQKQKRGKRAGLLAKLKADNNRLVIPSFLLANVRALDNKMDLLRLRINVYKEMRNCCMLLQTETWLNNNVPDSALQISGMLLHQGRLGEVDFACISTKDGALTVPLLELIALKLLNI